MSDPDEDRKDRSERLKSRFESDPDQTDQSAQTSSTSQPSNSSEPSEISNTPQPSNQSMTSKTSNTGTGAGSNTSNTSKTAQADKTAEMDKSSSTPVKDRPSVLMYLPRDIKQELSIRFDEINAEYKREHGEELEKNRDFYPAVVEAGLTGKDLEDILGL